MWWELKERPFNWFTTHEPLGGETGTKPEGGREEKMTFKEEVGEITQLVKNK